MNKTEKITISVDPELKDAYKRAGILISPIAEQLLRAYAIRHKLLRAPQRPTKT